MSCNTGLVMMSSFSFFLSGKLFVCPVILNDSFAEQSNLGCRSLLSITVSVSCKSLLACKGSVEKSDNRLTGAPLWVTSCFSFVAFDSLFVFNLWYFNDDVSWCGPLYIHLVWDCLCFLNLYVFTKVGKFSFIIFSNKLSISCSSSPSDTPVIWMLVCLKMSQKLLTLSSFFFNYFFFLLF